jgi:DNA-binding transcriptional MerR regulator
MAKGTASTSLGVFTNASGYVSTAMGQSTTASGDYSTAMGRQTTASGYISTAMGYLVSTNSNYGSFIIGDESTSTTTNNTAGNQMMMRFDGGYRLYSKSDLSTGVSLASGGTSWGTISDSTKKEYYRKANGDYFLSSLSKLKLGSWNYNGMDPKNYRHYGPMAQEIYQYFGNDGIGTIGCDTILTTADMDGIMMICLQALERKTTELQNKNKELDERIVELRKQNKELGEANKRLEERLTIVEELTRKLSAPETTAKR